MLISEYYLGIQREMEARYERVVVMMEIGKFYEIYTFPMEDEREEGRAREVSRATNILLTRKNKNLPPSLTNPYMCGFPSHSLPRFVAHLVEKHGFTVVVYEQQGEAAAVTRVRRGIYSPAVMIGMEEETEIGGDGGASGVLAIRCLSEKASDRTILIMVWVGVSDGSTRCEEVAMERQEAMQMFVRMLDLYRPREVLLSEGCWEEMRDEIRRRRVMLHHLPEWEKQERRYDEIEYQEKVLARVFPATMEDASSAMMLTATERVGLERSPDLAALLVYVLDFLHDHHPLAIHRLSPPILASMEEGSGRVIFGAHSLHELNLLPSPVSFTDDASLLDLLDRTATMGGRRLLRQSLLTPIHDRAALEARYEEIEALLPVADSLDLTKKIQHCAMDAEQQRRRMEIGTFSVHGVCRFFRLLLDVWGLEVSVALPPTLIDCGRGHESILERWDLHFMQAWRSWDTDGVWRSTPPELVEKEHTWMTMEADIRQWIRQELGEEIVDRMVITEEECYLQLTKKMITAIGTRPEARLRTMSSGMRWQHPRLDRFWSARRALLRDMAETRRRLFRSEMEVLMETHDRLFRQTLDWIARLDLALSHAKNARRWRLTRPHPIEEEAGIHFKGLRHLIVEAASPAERYIPNDVNLDGRGILLFGQNSAGKSTLLKSVGAAVFMAQAGMFVPCEFMEWVPVRFIGTKIGARDNIWRGKSTFITEMGELRYMLDRANSRSLILCDELTSGTETFSATGILASTLQRLAEQNAHFIITTHLHTLRRFPELLEKVCVMHLGMELQFQSPQLKLVFDRILRPGFGKSIYGLEIAEFLGFSSEFVQRAYAYRGRLEEEPVPLIPNKRSRYNKKKIVDRCERCQSTRDLHTHHVLPQSLADKEGYIGTQPKNALHNLQILCRACHEEEHHHLHS